MWLYLFLITGSFAVGFYFNRIKEAVEAAEWFTKLKG